MSKRRTSQGEKRRRTAPVGGISRNIGTPDAKLILTSATISTPPSPRTSSESEKTELQELNKRLELYILCQREKEASNDSLGRGWEVSRKAWEAEKMILESRLETERKAHREKHSELAADNVRLQQEIERQLPQLEQARAQSEKDQREAEKLARKSELLSRELQSTKSKLSVWEEEKARLLSDLGTEREESNRLRKDIAKERKRADDASEILEVERSKLKRLKDDFELETETSRQTILKFQEDSGELVKKNAELEDKLREEFGAQLKEFLATRLAQWEIEKTSALSAQKASYEPKLKLMKAAAEQDKKKVETLAAQSRDLTMKFSAVEREVTLARIQNEILQKQNDDLNSKCGDLDKKYRDQVEEKERIILRINARGKQLAIKFRELAARNIGLTMEIKAYRLLLENEEHRLGLPSEDDSKEALSSAPMSIMTDVEGCCITILNMSVEPVELRGWSLKAGQTDKTFEFPADTKLDQGAVLTVWTGLDAKKQENLPSEIAWVIDNMWAPKGDLVQLFNPSGQVVDSHEVTPVDREE